MKLSPPPSRTRETRGRAQPDWFERWHRALDRRYEGTVDAAAIRLTSWCVLLLVLLYAWARLWSDSIQR